MSQMYFLVFIFKYLQLIYTEPCIATKTHSDTSYSENTFFFFLSVVDDAIVI